MADVVFFGIGATGFSDSGVQILEGNRSSQAEVQFEGLVATAPRAGLSTEAVLLSPSQVPRAEFTQVELFNSPLREPASINPNVNDLVLFISGGPTTGARAVNVLLVPAPIPQGDGTILQPIPQSRDLRLFEGDGRFGSLVGKTVVFVQPTGASVPAPIRGMTGTIQSIGNPTGVPFAFTSTNGLPTAACAIVFEGVLPVQPTTGDRAVVLLDDRLLRRTPVIEVILE